MQIELARWKQGAGYQTPHTSQSPQSNDFDMIRATTLLPVLALVALVGCRATTEGDTPPNVVIFFTDDQGYGDLSSFGNPTIHTPHLDKMAAEGMKLT